VNLTILKSKLHRVTVTDISLDYEGSCGIDKVLMKAADIYPYEQIHIYNITNGNRFTTYAISSNIDGEISIRGGAARLALPNDIIVICTYCQLPEHFLFNNDNQYLPKTIYVNEKNKILKSSK
jgi:aspartate 1-decarboxylase